MRNQRQLRDIARRLRRTMTEAEHFLWPRLRQRRLLGLRFRRQHPLAGFVLDFYCLELRLAIEVDGGQHAGSRNDQRRDALLRNLDILVLRYWNDEVLSRTDEVLADIARHCEERRRHVTPAPLLLPPPAGEAAEG